MLKLPPRAFLNTKGFNPQPDAATAINHFRALTFSRCEMVSKRSLEMEKVKRMLFS
jgi:hypothetical protein